MSGMVAHSDGTSRPTAGEPSPWVARFLSGIRPGGRVLDVACGRGRHVRAALAAGFAVTGVDRDLSGLAELRGTEGVELFELDLEAGATTPLQDRFGAEAFDGVIVTNYLWRPILADIITMVRPDGVLIYETFALGNERVGHRKPSNPSFLLKPGELLEVIRPRLTAFAYEHVLLREPARVVQRVAAAGRGHRWLGEAPEA